jgi:hypothetical protein
MHSVKYNNIQIIKCNSWCQLLHVSAAECHLQGVSAPELIPRIVFYDLYFIVFYRMDLYWMLWKCAVWVTLNSHVPIYCKTILLFFNAVHFFQPKMVIVKSYANIKMWEKDK